MGGYVTYITITILIKFEASVEMSTLYSLVHDLSIYYKCSTTQIEFFSHNLKIYNLITTVESNKCTKLRW